MTLIKKYNRLLTAFPSYEVVKSQWERSTCKIIIMIIQLRSSSNKSTKLWRTGLAALTFSNLYRRPFLTVCLTAMSNEDREENCNNLFSQVMFWLSDCQSFTYKVCSIMSTVLILMYETGKKKAKKSMMKQLNIWMYH